MMEDINDRPPCASLWHVQNYRSIVSNQTGVLRLPFIRNHHIADERLGRSPIPLKVAWTDPQPPHVSRSTAAIMTSSVTGVCTMCGRPVFTTHCLTETLMQSNMGTMASAWRSANCRADAPAGMLATRIEDYDMSLYSTCVYSIIILSKLTDAAHRVLRADNNTPKRREE